MIVGWRAAGHMRTEMVLDAIEMARWSRGTHNDGLRCHSDAGSHVDPLRRTPRRDRRDPLDRDRRRQLRQRPGRDRQRLLQDRADPRTGTCAALAHRRRRRARHPRLGPLAQHHQAARLPRRRPTHRVRDDVLRYPRERPDPGRNPITRASIRPRAIQFDASATALVRRGGLVGVRHGRVGL